MATTFTGKFVGIRRGSRQSCCTGDQAPVALPHCDATSIQPHTAWCCSTSAVAAYYQLLHDHEPAVREEAARDWCRWEDAHVAVRPNHRPDSRYEDPRFRMAFARLVTHYWHHAAFLEDGMLVGNAGRLAGVPGVLVHGGIDLSSPSDIPWLLSEAWPGSELKVIDQAGHGGGQPGIQEAVVAALDRFATR